MTPALYVLAGVFGFLALATVVGAVKRVCEIVAAEIAISRPARRQFR
jgi:hypothetical protein